MSYDDDDEMPRDRFGDALATFAAAFKSGIKRLRAIEGKITAAEQKLERVTAQANGIVEGAKAEAARIVKEAADGIAEEMARREDEKASAAWHARFDRISAANPAWTSHQVMVAMAEEDDRGSRTRRGTSGEEFLGTLSRNLPS